MSSQDAPAVVIHGKISSYLPWSQPFIHELLAGLGRHVTNVVLCNRTENLDRFPMHAIERLPTRYLIDPPMAFAAAAYLRRTWKPSLVHAHFGWTGIRFLLLRQFLRVPLVTTFGGRDAGVQMHLPHFDQLYHTLLEMSEQIICVSDDLKRQLTDRGADASRIAVIHRGTDLSRFCFVDRASRNPTDPVKVLMVSRLVPKKGHRYAIEAVAQCIREGSPTQLNIVGDGDLHRPLKRHCHQLGVRDAVRFLPAMDHDAIRTQMRDADIFLHPSVMPKDGDCEGIPNVTVEASATGLPVIGTRHGGIPEVVRDEKTGLLVAERDVKQLARALKRLADRPTERLRMGLAAASLMRNEFDAHNQVAKHVEIYHRVVAENPRHSERMRRMWINDDYTDVVRHAFYGGIKHTHTSLANLVGELFGTGRLDRPMMGPDPGVLHALFKVWPYLPATLRESIPRRISPIALWILQHRKRFRDSGDPGFVERLNESVLHYVHNGGHVDPIDPAWSPKQLANYLVDCTSADGGDGEPVHRAA